MLRRQRTFLGIPMGRRRRRSVLTPGNLARAGALGAAALGAVPAARHGRGALGKAQDAAGKAADLAGTAGQVKDAVSSHSSTVGKAFGMVGALRHMGDDHGPEKPKLSHLIEENIEISVPRHVAYNQWTQMEMFPRLVKGVESVDQLNDERTEWTTKIGPVHRRWKARITEQVPDERIVWESENGPQHRGAVSFHSLDEELTRVLVQMHYVPHGPLEVVANKLRIQRRRVRRDLRLFKHHLELTGEQTGEWRGSIGSDSNGSAPASETDRDSGADREASGPSRTSGAGQGGGARKTAATSSRTSGRSRTSSSGRASSSSTGGSRTSGGRTGGSRNGSSSGSSAASKNGRSTRRSAASTSGGSSRSAAGRSNGSSTRAREKSK